MSKKSGLAAYFIKQIQRLSRIEAHINNEKLPAESAHSYRKDHAKQVIDKIKSKLDEAASSTPPQSLLGKAIQYTANQWPKLLTYLEDGRLEISNNRLERAIKPFATGRKNWLFANSVPGANAAATIYSLIETCKAHQVDPYNWLRKTLEKIPDATTVDDFEALLPFNNKAINFED